MNLDKELLNLISHHHFPYSPPLSFSPSPSPPCTATLKSTIHEQWFVRQASTSARQKQSMKNLVHDLNECTVPSIHHTANLHAKIIFHQSELGCPSNWHQAARILVVEGTFRHQALGTNTEDTGSRACQVLRPCTCKLKVFSEMLNFIHHVWEIPILLVSIAF